MRIAIQGQLGSFHDTAARQWFGDDIHIVPAETFADVFGALNRHEADSGIVAIENSLYGSINQVYDLIESHRYPIVGELHLHVHQQLIGTPGATVTHIYSQTMALQQCENYLDINYPDAKRVEYFDTAASVEYIRAQADPHLAAIASARAAELYDMPVIAANIEDNPHNFTRFLIITPGGTVPANADRTSLVITTDHTPGALAKVLTVFADAGINLSKLQSRPIPGKPWHYRFYLVVDAAGPELHTALDHIKPLVASLVILGEYKHDN